MSFFVSYVGLLCDIDVIKETEILVDIILEPSYADAGGTEYCENELFCVSSLHISKSVEKIAVDLDANRSTD
jgi:hypothetical protein